MISSLLELSAIYHVEKCHVFGGKIGRPKPEHKNLNGTKYNIYMKQAQWEL